MTKHLCIGVTDCSKYTNYSRWIEQFDQNIEVIKLGYTITDEDALKKCDAIVFTGGEDVHPTMYHKPEYIDFCYKDDISISRDEYEWKVMEYAQANELPVLGICRGLQFINVFFGGTLIPDIPTWGRFSHAKLLDGRDRQHSVQIDPYSMLHKIIGTDQGMINSNHHQSADTIGNGLVVSAVSPDGVAEAMERKDPSSAAFLCLVQWHPERMADQQSSFVNNIKNAFMDAALHRHNH